MGFADKLSSLVKNSDPKCEVVSKKAAAACVLAKVYEEIQELYIANAGDTRAYLVRGDRIVHSTVPENWPGIQYFLGFMTDVQIRSDPNRFILPGGLLGQGKFYEDQEELSMYIWKYREGDRLVLCCDGLWESTPSDADLAQIVGEAKSVKQASENLVKIALENEAEDDISVIVVQL